MNIQIFLALFATSAVSHATAGNTEVKTVQNPYFNGGLLGYTYSNGDFDKVQVNFVKNPDSKFGLDDISPFFLKLGWPKKQTPTNEETAQKTPKKVTKREAPPELAPQQLPLASPSETAAAYPGAVSSAQNGFQPKYQGSFHSTQFSTSFSSDNPEPKVTVQEMNLHLDNKTGTWVSDDPKDKKPVQVLLESRFGDEEEDFRPNYFRPFIQRPISPPRFSQSGQVTLPSSGGLTPQNWGLNSIFPSNPQLTGSFPFPATTGSNPFLMTFPGFFGSIIPVINPPPPISGNPVLYNTRGGYFNPQVAYNPFASFPFFAYNYNNYY